MDISKLKIWIITEGIAGTENQCIGVAEALGADADIKRISLNFPWNILSPPLLYSFSWSFRPTLSPPWPDLVIAAGRKSIAASHYIKRQSQGKTMTVQLQDPRISPAHFDLVAVPHHDRLRGDNVIVTDGAPNRISQAHLETAKEEFRHLFEKLPSPRIAVLIGGNSKAYNMTDKVCSEIVRTLRAVRGSDKAGLMITTSRRTGEKYTQQIRDAMLTTDTYFWNGEGINPYMGMLAWADTIFVTNDSVSMMSDAATTGKPIYLLPLQAKTTLKTSSRLKTFQDHLWDSGACAEYSGTLEKWTYIPFQDSARVADTILSRLQYRMNGKTAQKIS